MKRVVVLRPEPGATATCDAARRLGLDPIAIPLFAIEPLAWDAPDAASFDAVLLTSANALRAAGDGLQSLRGLPAYAVGKATAEAARNAGFDIAAVGDSGVERLLGSTDPALRVVHLCGEHRKDSSGVRQAITAVPVYRSAEIPAGGDLAQVEGKLVLVHSRRAGARLAALSAEAKLDRARVTLAAISDDAAGGLGPGWAGVEVAEEPNDSSLLALASRLCNNPD
ncbi:uroporphyrinogen-III synthase [Sphingomonas sinipercae]|uniref:Uroporphyrinogen-III synthase n=1 Tax=Sphingomonas sinipercae TaxID=2714944 RepID=A0A6G7ZKQ4_9SPHN|nr:uroporphyrinogen-III synthase [Sphingomonas sinipercae]QIL01577.1 uroporphyrinogen-III synthase [Sphingomonas sinipercae]